MIDRNHELPIARQAELLGMGARMLRDSLRREGCVFRRIVTGDSDRS